MTSMIPAAEARRDGRWLLLIAAVLRLAVVGWAWGRIPPTADGSYYHVLASRLAEGHGYTWAWPDGVVTAAAHYPVGYPSMLAIAYRLLGAGAEVGMLLNGLVGASAAWAIHAMLCTAGHRRLAWWGGLLVALHPGLVAYTPALMTEGVAAALLCWAALGASRARVARSRRWLYLGLTAVALGAATLVRPQCLVVAPVFGALAWPRPRRRATFAAALVTALTLLACLPWTLRNCERMNRCALVSVNGGWNLLIGTQPEGHGGWSEIRVPDECREVFDEAGKDRCFERAARRAIRADPGAWLRLSPAKLSVTFDYCGAAGWYLHEANPATFDDGAKLALGVLETVYERALLLLALIAALRPSVWRLLSRRRMSAPRWASWLAAGVILTGAVSSLTRHGWVAHLALLALLMLRGRRLGFGHPVYGIALAVLGCVASVHVVFFGAGRYQMLILPFIAALAALGWLRLQSLRRVARARTSR
jgi:4-amino-4-deoxy-L-arabinose transferase-like glycosyltransferase